MQMRGTPIRVTVSDGELTVVITGGFSRPIKVGIGDDVRELGAGERCTFKLRRARDSPATARRAVTIRGISRGDLRRRRRARRLAARGGLARRVHASSWRATGRTSATRRRWTPGRLHAAGLPAGPVGQAAHGGRARRARALRRARARRRASTPTPTSSRRWSSSSSRPASSPPTPTRCASCSPSRTPGSSVAAASSSKNAGLFLRQIRLDEFAARRGPGLRLDRGRPDAARGLRRRHLRPPLRAAASRTRRSSSTAAQELGVDPRGGVRRRGRGLGHPGRQGRRVRRARRRAPRRRGRRSPTPAPTSSSARSTTSTSPASPKAGCAAATADRQAPPATGVCGQPRSCHATSSGGPYPAFPSR